MAHAPESLRPLMLRVLLVFALLVVVVSASGCRKREATAPPSEDSAERTKNAWTLYRKAEGTAVPEKYELFRRLIAVYDDTEPGTNAYLELVVTLTRDPPPDLGEALKVARAFRDRHPKDERVGEAFLQVADTAYAMKDDATRKSALADWAKHLEDRDIAGDIPKAVLYVDMVRVRLRQERWEDSEIAIDTALAEPGISGADRVELLVRKGNLLADILGRREEGRAAFQKALELSRELHGKKMGQRVIPPDKIEEELKKHATESR